MEKDIDKSQCGAQLVSTSNLLQDPILLLEPIVKVGRSRECDISFEGNRYISANHCNLQVKDGDWWLHDTSTNGTFLNNEHIKIHRTSCQLKHGDEIFIVYKENDPDATVSFLYQSKKGLDEDNSDGTDTFDDTFNMTQIISDKDNTNNDENDIDHTADAEGSCNLKGRGTPSDVGSESDFKLHASYQHIKQSGSANEDNQPGTTKRSADSGGLGEVSEKKVKLVGECKQGNTSTSADDLEESLVCSICQEVFHECVSLQPCLHSFCAGCYSGWMRQSNCCPTCRVEIKFISKNHLVMNMVEAFLKNYPDRIRPEEDLEKLNKENKIKLNSVPYPRNYPLHDSLDDEDEDGDDGEDADEEPDFTVAAEAPVFPAFPLPAIVAAPYVPIGLQALPVQCRQCVGYAGQQVSPRTPAYTCPPNQNHIICQCCLLPMPDRTLMRVADGNFPCQTCVLCFRQFCHDYWGCHANGCQGCLLPFNRMTFDFDDTVLPTIILENSVESGILQEYLTSHSMTVVDLWTICCDRVEDGEFTTSDLQNGRMTMTTPTCRRCALRNFRELAYQFREEISPDELPVAWQGRPDCHWGHLCRTQRSKLHHAQRYNHVCMQTHFG